MELLKELCECSGVPGREERLREIVRRELEPIADELRVDGMGNLIIKKNASAGENPKKLMLAAHMDEIGFVVSHINKQGLLRLVPLGGHDPRNMVAQRVTVAGTEKDYTGLLYPGVKPPAYPDRRRPQQKTERQRLCRRSLHASRRRQRRNRNRRNGHTATRLCRNWQWRKL